MCLCLLGRSQPSPGLAPPRDLDNNSCPDSRHDSREMSVVFGDEAALYVRAPIG